MVIKPNVLQGVFFWLFGAITTTILIVSVLKLLPLVTPLGKADFGTSPKLPFSSDNSGDFIVLMSSLAVWLSSYSVHRRNMRMTLPTWAKGALFGLGIAFNASACLVAYLWARSVL